MPVNHHRRTTMTRITIACAVLLGAALACVRSSPIDPIYWSVSEGSGRQAPTSPPAQDQAGVPTPALQVLTPTPDPPHPLPPIRTEAVYYVLQPGDTLGRIAQRYTVSLRQLIAANAIENPDLIPVGMGLTIPVPEPEETGPGFKVIPDSELVYGPGNAAFDVAQFVRDQGGYLAHYSEEFGEFSMTGVEIVQQVALDFSVNPRLLLAVLEHQSGWVAGSSPDPKTLDYPIGVKDPQRKGLYRQLTWAANNLNRGFYTWRVNGVPAWLLSDDKLVPIAPVINAGTAGVQYLFSMLYGYSDWLRAVSPEGLFGTYVALFGYPFDYGIEPLLPPDLKQPALQLPFERGFNWAFTGGPHGGWGDGSAWAALDFAPPGEALGCVQSDAWVAAAADGLIVRSGAGAVVQDLDGDGLEQTGWSLLYMHIETRDRVPAGTYLKAGERIGHPSCEGGVSSGTHVHIARRFNGEWIPADRDLPFVLDGWVSVGAGYEYDGYLQRDGVSLEAYAGRSPGNGIQR